MCVVGKVNVNMFCLNVSKVSHNYRTILEGGGWEVKRYKRTQDKGASGVPKGAKKRKKFVNDSLFRTLTRIKNNSTQ